MKNTLQFIKKTRPKLKVGDYFYYHINSKFYIGIIVQNNVYMNNLQNVKDTINCCLFLNVCERNIEKIKEETIKQSILNENLLLPPINLNKKGWTTGFFVKLGNIKLDFVFKSQNLLRFVYGQNSIYDINYTKTDNIPSLSLVAEIGVYAIEGLEALLQISLDLKFSTENPEWFNPYEYYDKIKGKSKEKLPSWYYKAKKSQNISLSHQKSENHPLLLLSLYLLVKVQLLCSLKFHHLFVKES